MAATAYIHSLKGRLRVTIGGVKGSPLRAVDVEARLRKLTGIHRVSANPLTGNVLILYDDAVMAEHELLETLTALGLVRPEASARGAGQEATDGLARLIAESLTRSTVELAVQGLIRALI